MSKAHLPDLHIGLPGPGPGLGGVSAGTVASLAASLADSASTTKDLAKTLPNGTAVTGSLTVTDSGTGDTGYSAKWTGSVKEADGDTGSFSGTIVKVTGTSYALDTTTADSSHGTTHIVANETIAGTGSTQVVTIIETITHTATDGTVTVLTENETFTGGKLTAGTVTYPDGTSVDLTTTHAWYGHHDAGLFIPFF